MNVMSASLNSLLKSIDLGIKNSKKPAKYIINSKINEVNNLSSLLDNYSNDEFLNRLHRFIKKSTRKNKKAETTNLTINNASNKKIFLFNSFKSKSPNLLYNNFRTKKSLRKFIIQKEKSKAKLTLDKSKLLKADSKDNINNKKIFAKFKLNYSNNKSNISPNIGENSKTENNILLDLNNFKKPSKKKVMKLSKKPKNKKLYLSSKNFPIHFNSLLDNIIRNKENEFDNILKNSSNNVEIDKIYGTLNQFNRKVKTYIPSYQDYHRETTISNEKKMSIPYLYNEYLNKTKKVYNELNKTYFDLKSDITNDIDYDKKPSKKKRAVTAKEIKYEEMHKDVKKMKRDIGYITPSTDLFIGTTSNFQFITNLSEQLNKLNSSIAYQHRYYLGKRYGFDAKKDLLKINFDDNEYPANLKKSNDHHEN
jgi:hypothetical protein